jgi:hypothetical protein
VSFKPWHRWIGEQPLSFEKPPRVWTRLCDVDGCKDNGWLHTHGPVERQPAEHDVLERLAGLTADLDDPQAAARRLFGGAR